MNLQSKFRGRTYDGVTTDAKNNAVSVWIPSGTTSPVGPDGGDDTGVLNATTTNEIYTLTCLTWNRETKVQVDDVISRQREIAYTDFLATGGPTSAYDCYTYPVTKVTICAYPVKPNCLNTAKPDYTAVAVNDNEWWLAWYSLGDCWRTVSLTTGAHGPWYCAPGPSYGTVDTIGSNRCTYNP
jgi:hypothetical protein